MQKQEEIRHQVEDKAIEIRRLRYEERVRFHEELQEALEQYGRKAGPAIDQLCTRYGYESDPDRFEQGSRIWFVVRQADRGTGPVDPLARFAGDGDPQLHLG